MRNLLLGTAMVLPLMMAPALAQDTATPAPADPATNTTAAPMGADATPAADGTTMEAEAAADEADDAAAAAEVAASGKVEQQQAENELRIDWITDATVNAPDGTAIGDINDVIVDGDAGTVKAAVIGVGGFLGIGEKQIAVPWDQLTINYDAQEITSELTKEQAEAAPEYVFRDQESAPAEAGETGSPSMAPAPAGTDSTTTAPAGTAPTDSTATAPATGTDAAPMTTPDAAATTSTEPAATGAPTPNDTAETPATPPMGSDAAAPAADGTAPAPSN
ncbi:PRC-barrel domain-containing protein [Paracoccus sp. SSK6]|uniref:PRC-barrel domain-containing protein n=1 Tax=Paracoccus sp. SSK6 TaxID=3143131 RepID=UPI003219463B